MKTIYEKAQKEMRQDEISHHESDLYLKKNEVSEKLVKNYEFKNGVKMFVSQIDGMMWYDIPFAYDPFWNKVK